MTTSRLRERIKARTRDEIIDAALTLFETKGYDATTCEDIAEAAAVSTRTFFRYFKTKLDVVMAAKGDEHREADIAAKLLARPPEESPIEALRHVVEEPIREISSGNNVAVRQYRLMMCTPSLRALQLEHFHAEESALAAAFATRLGRKPGDFGARLLAAALGASFRTAVDRWVSAGAKPGRLWPLVSEALDVLDRGFKSMGHDADG